MGDLKARQDPISGVVSAGGWDFDPRWRFWRRLHVLPEGGAVVEFPAASEVPPEVVEAVHRLLGWA